MRDLLLLDIDAASGEKTASLYAFRPACEIAGTALLSPDAASVTRLTTGMTGGRTAVFAEEKDESGVGQQTDIFLCADGELHNIAYDSENVGSQSTYRSVAVNVADVDQDGEYEIPRAVLMAGYPEGSGDALYMFDWYAYRLGESPAFKATTFRSAAERWYMLIPSGWHDTVYAVRETNAGVSSTTFYEYQPGDDGDPGEDAALLSIYYITGESRQYQANRLGLTVLSENDGALWGAVIPDGADGSVHAVTMNEVTEGFRLMTD